MQLHKLHYQTIKNQAIVLARTLLDLSDSYSKIDVGYILVKLLVLRRHTVIEPLLLGIVLGLIFITLAGLFFAAYMQYKRGNQLGID